jgi:YHS domain-containing protein
MARLLAWLLEAVVIIMVVRAVMRLFGGRKPAQSARTDGSPFQQKTPERIGGTLVRDPHCGTYIPESRAIRVTNDGETRYFCSAECRDAFRARA